MKRRRIKIYIKEHTNLYNVKWGDRERGRSSIAFCDARWEVVAIGDVHLSEERISLVENKRSE